MNDNQIKAAIRQMLANWDTLTPRQIESARAFARTRASLAERVICERLTLCQTTGVTLDGEPASIVGYANDFATVAQRHTGLRVEFAWATVARVVANGAAFKSF